VFIFQWNCPRKDICFIEYKKARSVAIRFDNFLKVVKSEPRDRDGVKGKYKYNFE
jgi:hypothetical protein